jgi:UDP-2,3-diacylglucosamine hydrolase
LSGPARTGGVAFVGDVHLDRDDHDLEVFLSFLDGLGRDCARIVFMGDLFNIWLGRRELQLPHHDAVLDRLRVLRARGLRVEYVEGNRDYRVGACYAGDVFDSASLEGIEVESGGIRVFAAHGDLANASDLRYRSWRRFSRSAIVWGLFNLLPARRRIGLAEGLERRLRATNLDYKLEFPLAEVREYGAAFLEAGYDALVLGHFHIEKQITLEAPRPGGRIFVLPEWKGSRRHLELRPGGWIGFVDSVC